MSATGMFVMVTDEIVKAAAAASQNKARCGDIANRARAVRDTFSYSTALRKRPAMDKLRAAMDDALNLVKSQNGFLASFTGGTSEASFRDVERRIDACVKELGRTEQFESRIRVKNFRSSLGFRGQEKWGMDDFTYNDNKSGGPFTAAAAAAGAAAAAAGGAALAAAANAAGAANNMWKQQRRIADGRQQPIWMDGCVRKPKSYGATSTPPEQLQRSSAQSLLTQQQSSLSGLSSWSQKQSSLVWLSSKEQQSSQSGLSSSQKQSSLSGLSSKEQQSSRYTERRS